MQNDGDTWSHSQYFILGIDGLLFKFIDQGSIWFCADNYDKKESKGIENNYISQPYKLN